MTRHTVIHQLLFQQSIFRYIISHQLAYIHDRQSCAVGIDAFPQLSDASSFVYFPKVKNELLRLR